MWDLNTGSDLSITTTVNGSNGRSSSRCNDTGSPLKDTAENGQSSFHYSPTIPDTREDQAKLVDVQNSSLAITRLALWHVFILLAVSVPILLLGTSVAVPSWWNANSYSRSLSFTHCNYDGSFTPYTHRTLGLWRPSSFFQINLFWGHMTFSLAKFLDVGFDLVIGRGLQAMLAITTYKVSAKVLTQMMETTHVSYRTFEALAFVSPSLAKTSNLMAELMLNRGVQARATILLLIVSSIFVVAFPTLASAMSGYSNNMIAYFQTRDGQTVLWSDVQVVQFIINDGSRLGAFGPVSIHSSPACLLQGPGMSITANSTSLIYRRDDDSTGAEDLLWNTVPATCRPFWRTVEYITQYGINTSSPIRSEYYLGDKEIDVEAPTLNITTSYDSKSIRTLTEVLTNSLHNTSTSHLVLESVSGAAIRQNTTFIFENQTYSFDYVMHHASCRPTNSHNWGFSFLFLFTTVLLLSLWSITMYILWLHVYLHSRLDRSGRYLGTYRASLDLVQAIKQDSSVEVVTDEMSDQSIRQMIRKRHGRRSVFENGGITYQHMSSGLPENRQTDLSKWLRGPRHSAGTRATSCQHNQDPDSPTSHCTAWSSLGSKRHQLTDDVTPKFEFRNDLGG